MPTYTQSELLKQNFKGCDQGILGGLLRNGLYILGATSKVGKTMIATSLTNAVANGTEYLGKTNTKGKVFYYDNDNYDFEAQQRVQALKFGDNDNIRYVFGEESSSLREIKMDLSYELKQHSDVKLIIIDSLMNLNEFIRGNFNYENVYPLLKDFRDFIVGNHLVCIILHHTKKGEAVGQDRLLGPKAMSGATTGSIILNVESEFSSAGQLEFMLRHKKEIIPIKKDEQGIGSVLSEEEEINEEIPKSILSLINTVVSQNNQQLLGTSQEIVQRAKMEINPMSLYKYMMKNQNILHQNGITFEKQRTSSKRQILIQYLDKE